MINKAIAHLSQPLVNKAVEKSRIELIEKINSIINSTTDIKEAPKNLLKLNIGLAIKNLRIKL